MMQNSFRSSLLTTLNSRPFPGAKFQEGCTHCIPPSPLSSHFISPRSHHPSPVSYGRWKECVRAFCPPPHAPVVCEDYWKVSMWVPEAPWDPLSCLPLIWRSEECRVKQWSNSQHFSFLFFNAMLSINCDEQFKMANDIHSTGNFLFTSMHWHWHALATNIVWGFISENFRHFRNCFRAVTVSLALLFMY